MPLIFEKPLSKVRMGRLNCIPVAAIKASAKEIFRFCRSSIATSFISGLYEISKQSSKRALQAFSCDVVIPGIPNNSISVTKEIANSFSVYGINRASPSSKLIRMFVSARKSIFTSNVFLVLQPVYPSFQSAKVLLERRFFSSLFKLR